VGTPTWDGLPLHALLVIAGHAQPHAPLVERWALEQTHRGAWLLLEEMQLLRCESGLHLRATKRRLPASLVDRIEAIVAETGQTGFHFVDEAAPPKALKALAEELIRRRVHISWWGNIRFEKTFTPELAELLAAERLHCHVGRARKSPQTAC
jgi:hypothetical protein